MQSRPCPSPPVILSEQSESKDLFAAKHSVFEKILRLRFAPLRMTFAARSSTLGYLPLKGKALGGYKKLSMMNIFP